MNFIPCLVFLKVFAVYIDEPINLYIAWLNVMSVRKTSELDKQVSMIISDWIKGTINKLTSADFMYSVTNLVSLY